MSPPRAILAGIVARCRHDEREDDGKLTVPIDIKIQQLRSPHQPPIIFDDVCKTLLKPYGLCHFTMVKGDIFTVFASAHHAESKICLIALLVEVEFDQFAANTVGKVCSKSGVEQGQPKHIAIDGKFCRADGNCENA